jgi:hypothetical protein
LTVTLGRFAQSQGKPLDTGTIHLDMWRTNANLTTTSGSSTAHLPTDYDHWISFWDNTHSKRIYPVEDTHRWQRKSTRFRDRGAGPTEAIEIKGGVTNSSTWVRVAELLPSVVSGVTPSIRMDYWRLPAKIVGSDTSSEYPDIDVKWEELLVVGTSKNLLRNDDPLYDRYDDAEKTMLFELARAAGAM